MKKLPRLIGVLHLEPLPGAPGASGEHPRSVLEHAGARAIAEARQLEKAGFEALILENFGDIPFYKKVPPETVAAMSIIAGAVRESVRIPLGINILRNDARAALAVAAVSGAEFFRVNVLNGIAATDQGMIEGEAAELVRERDRLGVPDIAIFADAEVKHARSLSSRSMGLAVEEVALRAMADAVIITGATTGRPVELEALREANAIAREQGIKLLIGSGSSPATLPTLLPLVHGIIVGSAIRQGGRAAQPLDARRIRDYVRAFKAASGANARRSSKKRR